MAKKATAILGAALLLVGLVGFLAPGLLGAHLSVAHNLVHLVTGAASLGFGLKGTREGARLFALAFGAVYGLLGVLGFVLGAPGVSTAGHATHDARLWAPIPGHLELGTSDHVIHLLLGTLYVAAAVATKVVRAPLASESPRVAPR
jgi:hypothetical protein